MGWGIFWRWYDRASRVDFAGTLLGLFFDWKAWLLGLKFGAGAGVATFFWAAIDEKSPLEVWIYACTALLAVTLLILVLSAVRVAIRNRQPRVLAIDAPSDVESPIEIRTGNAAEFHENPSGRLYTINHRLKLGLRNASHSKSIRDCKIQIVSIEPNCGYRGPWTIAEGLTIAPGDEIYIPLASRNESRGSTSGDSSIEILVQNGKSPLLQIEQENALIVRVTGLDVPFREIDCRLWVDAEGVTRIRNASSEKRISLLDAAIRAYGETRGTLAAQMAERSGSNDRILTYYCFALTAQSQGSRAPMTALFGVRPPSKTVETLSVYWPSATYSFAHGKLVLEDRSANAVYENLEVLDDELSSAIQEISSWGR